MVVIFILFFFGVAPLYSTLGGTVLGSTSVGQYRISSTFFLEWECSMVFDVRVLWYDVNKVIQS